MKKQVKEIKEKFLRLNEDIFIIETDKPYPKQIMTYLKERAFKKR